MEQCCTASARVLKGDSCGNLTHLKPVPSTPMNTSRRLSFMMQLLRFSPWANRNWLSLVIDCLAEHFSNHLFTNTMTAESVIFERDDARSSLKPDIRARRQGSENPIYYHVTDTTHTHIGKVPLKKLFLHTKAKGRPKKANEHGRAAGRQVVVACGRQCQATLKDKGLLQSDHEEADTKIILLAFMHKGNLYSFTRMIQMFLFWQLGGM